MRIFTAQPLGGLASPSRTLTSDAPERVRMMGAKLRKVFRSSSEWNSRKKVGFELGGRPLSARRAREARMMSCASLTSASSFSLAHAWVYACR